MPSFHELGLGIATSARPFLSSRTHPAFEERRRSPRMPCVAEELTGRSEARRANMKLSTLAKVFEDQLKDLYSAETQLTKALPKMAKKSATPELKEAITSHLAETRHQLERLREIGEKLGSEADRQEVQGDGGARSRRGRRSWRQKGRGAVLDAALIAAAQRVEHYEIAGVWNGPYAGRAPGPRRGRGAVAGDAGRGSRRPMRSCPRSRLEDVLPVAHRGGGTVAPRPPVGPRAQAVASPLR